MRTTDSFTDAGRFTIRNPLAKARGKAADHPMMMFATLAGAALASFMIAPQTSAFAATETAVASSHGGAISHTRKIEADRICAGQAWGDQTSACVRALAVEPGTQPRARVRIIAIR